LPDLAAAPREREGRSALPGTWPLDAGMATFFAEEIIESIRYLKPPIFTRNRKTPADNICWELPTTSSSANGALNLWTEQPWIAAIVGAAPSPEVAKKIALELQEKNLYIFMCAENEGKRFSQQLVDAGVQIGWPTRLVSFGPISPLRCCHGFACAVAMAFGESSLEIFERIYLQQGPYLCFCHAPWVLCRTSGYANAAGAINWGFPTIADTPFRRFYLRASALTNTWSPTSPRPDRSEVR